MSGVHALILAAGSGSRFGGGKLLAPWRDGVLLDGALAAAFAAPVSGVTLVTGADAEAVEAAALAWARARGRTLAIVHAADHAEGMAASLRAGLMAVPDEAAGTLVFLGDMPLVPTSVLAPLVEALLSGAPAAVPTYEERRGNPAALSRALFDELLGLKGDKGARGVLDALGDRLVRVAAPDNGVLIDVDTPADLPK